MVQIAAAARPASQEMSEGKDKIYGIWLESDYFLVTQPLRNRCPGNTNARVVRRTLRKYLDYTSEKKSNKTESAIVK